MNANNLILFSQIIELGSFSKVAELNNLTKSVVSKRIAKLESELGVQLLYRTTRKLTVTEAGKALAAGAKNVQEATAEATRAVSGFEENITGLIKMSVPTISGDLVLTTAVAEFCDRHPGLRVEMSLDNRFVDLVQDGYDLAIRTGFLEDSSLIARHIIDSQWVVCTSQTYLDNHGEPQTPKDLVEHNCLHYLHPTRGATGWEFRLNEGNQQNRKSESHNADTYSVNVNGSFSTNNASSLRKAVLNGYGIAYIPRCLVYPDLRSGKLIELFPALVHKNIGVYAVYPYTKHPPLKIKRLIEFIKQEYEAISHYFSPS